MNKSLRLLLIEDSENDELLLLRLLKRGGYDVQHVRVDTAEGMQQALASQTWDIIISDYAMPQFSGLSALQLMQRWNYDLPFIIISGTIGEEHAVKIIKAGADDYLMKDNLLRLIPAIDRAIREKEQLRAHKQAEATIGKLSQALEQSASLILMTDAQGIIEYVNESLLRVTGYEREELIGQYWGILWDKSRDTAILNDIRSTIAAEGRWNGELLSQRKDGQQYWVYANISAIRDDENEIKQYLVVQEDVTERKRLEEELQRYTEGLEQMVDERTTQLRHAKEQIEIILNSSNDGIVLALNSGDIQRANPAFRNLFGDRVSKSIEELIYLLPTESDMQEIAEILVAVLRDKRNGRTQASILREDGTPIDVDVLLSPVQTGDDQPDGVIVSVRDITPIKDLERFKENFVANAAHDLSSPISALKTHLYLLKAKPERLTQYLEVLEQQTYRLEMLVSELRTLSELDRGEIKLQRTSANLNTLIKRVVLGHQVLATEKEQQLSFKPDEHLPEVWLDRNRFERVILNLVANAINYTPEGGTITVKTHFDESWVSFSVVDTGIGIDEEAQQQVFQRFYRTSRAKETNMLGTGLGLSIVKEMVEAHNGKIEVHSEVNVGTTFTVFLPITRNE